MSNENEVHNDFTYTYNSYNRLELAITTATDAICTIKRISE